MSVSGIRGQILEVTVVGCTKLKDTEWISRQDPYVCLEYGSNKFRTRTCTDGGKNPTFQEKFIFTLIEGLEEINIAVWNSNTLIPDDFIGSGKIQLQKVLSQGFDDSSWSLQSKRRRHSGEVKLIMHYQNVNKAANTHGPSAPPYAAAAPPTQPQCSHSISYPPVAGYSSITSYPPPASAFPPVPVASYPQAAPYPYPPQPSAYPPPPYPPSYYPPPPYRQPPYPGYPGTYPPY